MDELCELSLGVGLELRALAPQRAIRFEELEVHELALDRLFIGASCFGSRFSDRHRCSILTPRRHIVRLRCRCAYANRCDSTAEQFRALVSAASDQAVAAWRLSAASQDHRQDP